MQNGENKSEIRLNRYLAKCGLGSRRETDRLIASGKIGLNGKKVTELGIRINPDKVKVTYRGKPAKEIKMFEYIAYHKSRGIVVTSKDPQCRETIYDAMKSIGFNGDHLNYIGRLDRNSEGLILLTNDGDLIYALTHPRFHIKKVYHVRINKELREDDYKKIILSGVISKGERLRAGAVRNISPKLSPKEFRYEIDLYEGKNRQIRRIFESLGYKIVRLKRTEFGGVRLYNLKRGKYRVLKDSEVCTLREMKHHNRKK